MEYTKDNPTEGSDSPGYMPRPPMMEYNRLEEERNCWEKVKQSISTVPDIKPTSLPDVRPRRPLEAKPKSLPETKRSKVPKDGSSKLPPRSIPRDEIYAKVLESSGLGLKGLVASETLDGPPRLRPKAATDEKARNSKEILEQSQKYYEECLVYANRMEREDEVMVSNIENIISMIKKLLEGDNSTYDNNSQKITRMLDRDEGWFFANLWKLQKHGNLSNFLRYAKGDLGKYRIIETYQMRKLSDCKEIRRKSFQGFELFYLKGAWLKIYQQIELEDPKHKAFVSAAGGYNRLLIKIIEGYRNSEDLQTVTPPKVLRTPFINELKKAAHETSFSEEYFRLEIGALAERQLNTQPFVLTLFHSSWATIFDNMDYDLDRLRFFFQGDDKGYKEARKRIKSFYKKFFKPKNDEDYGKALKVKDYLKPTAAENLARLSIIFNNMDEAKLHDELNEFLEEKDEYDIKNPNEEDSDEEDVADCETVVEDIENVANSI